jgi:hypothetical protein
MHTYEQSLGQLRLSGPTYFRELIDTAHLMTVAPYRADYQHYTVLLIITDGMINDMQKTIDSIVEAADKPLSIIISGVGDADFTNMEVLDGDDQRLRSRTKVAARDIVQFVAMRDFKQGDSHRYTQNQATSYQETMRLLAEHTLAEVPQQVVSFMRLHGIKAMPPRQAVYAQPPPLDRPGTCTGAASPGAGAPPSYAQADAPPANTIGYDSFDYGQR